MAEITTGTPTPVPAAPATPAVLQKVENAAFAFLQAHYSKLIAAAIGWAVSHFGLLGKFL
jgi:hypothetical protein